LFSASEDGRLGRARAHQAAVHTEQHDIAPLTAQAPGVEGDPDQADGQDLKSSVVVSMVTLVTG
jgi:hypothetical protein